jgi:putative PIG3 family NAD(P)H quinone oxidoreductase
VKAIVVDSDSPELSLSWRDVPDPSCGSQEVLVDIHATAVNRADLLQRSGNYPPPPGAPPYLGLEMSGTVVSTGSAATGWQPGDRICALLAGGGYAEKTAVHHQMLVPIPDEWSFATAAAVPEVFYTAFVNLFLEAELKSGETALIHGGASGVGTAAIQLAREAGCRVVATAGSQEKLDRCRSLGAELVINYTERDFVDAILDHCDGIDVILDIVGGNYLEQNLKSLKLRGRLVVISLLGGSASNLDLGAVLGKRLRIIGSLLRSRPVEEKIAIVRQFEDRFWQLLVTGRVEPVIHQVLPITEVERAHQILADNRNIGKVVLQVR